MRRIDGRLEYLFRQADGWPNKVVPSDIAFNQWPFLVFEFLQHQVQILSTDEDRRVDFIPIEAKEERLIGAPIRM